MNIKFSGEVTNRNIDNNSKGGKATQENNKQEQFEHVNIEVNDYKKFIGQERHKVFEEALKYIDKQHDKGRDLILPELDYRNYVLKNPDKAPQSMKDGNYYYMGGIIADDAITGKSVYGVHWDGSKFEKHEAGFEFGEWDPADRVVFLEDK